MLIREMPSEEKPRERLKKYGSASLSNEELLAIILRSGTKNMSASDLALNVLNKVDSVSNLPTLTYPKLKEIKGLGEVKALSIIAALELGKRVYCDKKSNDIKLNSVDLVYDLFKSKFVNMTQEAFMVIFLDTKQKLICYKTLFMGTVDSSTVHPREIFKEAYLNSASFIICLHNHPSGNPTPSLSDKAITENLMAISKIMLIPILDHIIIGNNTYYSFLEHGNIK